MEMDHSLLNKLIRKVRNSFLKGGLYIYIVTKVAHIYLFHLMEVNFFFQALNFKNPYRGKYNLFFSLICFFSFILYVKI